MSKYKHFLCLLGMLTLGLSGCKIKQEIPQNRPLLPIPKQFTASADTSALSLPTLQTFFADSLLRQLIGEALNNNFDLQMALQRIEMARAGVRLTQGLGRPDLTAVVSAGGRKFGRYTIDGVGNFDTKFSNNLDSKQRIPDPFVPDYFVGGVSSWEIDLWGKLSSQKKAATARLLASEAGKNLVVTSLVADVASAYYQLLILDNELLFLEENIALQQSALDIVRVMKQSGEANQLGVELLNAQLLASTTLKVDVRQEIVELENRINFLLGRFPQPIARTAVPWERVIPPRLSATVPSRLLENRPDIKQAEYELLASNANLYAAKAAFYPSFNISAGLGVQAFRAMVLLSPASVAYNALGSLTAPLLNRRQLAADLMASKAEQQMAYTQYQQRIVGSFTEVYNFLNLIDNTNEMYTLKAQEVDVLRQSINTSRELFRFGRATYLEVITAQKNALQAQIELINLKKRQFNAVIGLYRSLGGGWTKA